MTPQSQQHCDHIKICFHVWNNIRHGCPYDAAKTNPDKLTCKHDTRSRPAHPAAPEPCRECDFDERDKHDTAIRNATLDEASRIIQNEWMCSLPEIVYILESLRTQEPTP